MMSIASSTACQDFAATPMQEHGVQVLTLDEAEMVAGGNPLLWFVAGAVAGYLVTHYM